MQMARLATSILGAASLLTLSIGAAHAQEKPKMVEHASAAGCSSTFIMNDVGANVGAAGNCDDGTSRIALDCIHPNGGGISTRKGPWQTSWYPSIVFCAQGDYAIRKWMEVA